MIVTAHFEDGTTQDFECPDWAEWIEYSGAGCVYVWNSKPVKKWRPSEDCEYCMYDNAGQPPECKFERVGTLPFSQRKDHKLTLHKITHE